jgi:hypothetical protein
MPKMGILKKNTNNLGFFLSIGKILNELINKNEAIVERLPVNKIEKKKTIKILK